jgi:hypothetical protein
MYSHRPPTLGDLKLAMAMVTPSAHAGQDIVTAWHPGVDDHSVPSRYDQWNKSFDTLWEELLAPIYEPDPI